MAKERLDSLLGAKIKREREARGWSQEALGHSLGISGSAINRYEKGARHPGPERLARLAALFGVTTDYLLGVNHASREPLYPPDSFIPWQRTIKIPLLGSIPAGEFRLTASDIEGWEDVPEEQVRGGEFFFLRVTGDCMAPLIQEGYMVLVRVQSAVEDGELAVVVINGEDAGLKRVRREGNRLMLYADNPHYPPIMRPMRDVRIIGKVVKFEGRP